MKENRNSFYVFLFVLLMDPSPPLLNSGVFSRFLRVHVVRFLAFLLLVEGVSVWVDVIVPIANDGPKWEVLGLNIAMDALVAHLNVV